MLKGLAIEGGPVVTLDDLGAWMLKCRPDVWDLEAYIEDGLDTIHDGWSVAESYRTELMAKDQFVLLWVTGAADARMTPGIWGIGVVSGEAEDQDPGEDSGYWLNEGQRQRSRHFVPVHIRLLPLPIPRSTLETDPRLSQLEILRAPRVSNPLVVTPAELEAIKDYLPAENDLIAWSAITAAFAGPQVRAEVELAAMEAVSTDYARRSWRVCDVSKQNLGWDLTCTSPHGEVHEVEVKGLSGLLPTILLTRNEFAAAQTRPGWRLAVVTSARSRPHIRYAESAEAVASATPLLYQVKLP